MSEINYQALREKAEKATKGSYIVGHTSVNQHGNLTGVFVCQKWKGEPGGVIAECHVNCLVETDAQAYANAEFIAAANPATVLALLDERERNQQYIKSRDQENEDIALTVGKLRVELEEAKSKLNEQREYYEGVIADGSKRIAELSASHSKLRDTMAGIHNTIRMDGGYTPLAAILNAAKRAYEESASAAGIKEESE
ncbi:ead/Ea22-like family protein [Escherichia coli]|nr:ead/Ea22-like family protein [Escherichia coli]EEC8733081.1 ead/Ea22-like family protein [Escherichia coli]EEC8738124.1 ead/Ea22-like family protein [Escherichia coli]EEC8979582.1 ead/Ea22-like family protein [Escherichia coli]EED0491414.1 ead/Ea22-like family protein [Escherichia coli]EED1467292.1 ead/Ea22-like family protein [Escherichia coli]